MTWKAGSETTVRGYKFTYDGLARIKNAAYGEGDYLSLNTNRFSEQVTGYDKQGNILGLSRYGQISGTGYSLIDNLTLSYNGNQLKAVKDNATNPVYGNGVEFKDGANAETEYTYDENGNLTKDFNKEITQIQYNWLDLPDKIQFETGNSISYLYAATEANFEQRTQQETILQLRITVTMRSMKMGCWSKYSQRMDILRLKMLNHIILFRIIREITGW